MEKGILLKKLEECIKVEESAIPLYTQHVHNTLFLSDFEKKDQDRVKAILMELKKDSEKHKKMFEDLLTEVKGSGKDVY